MKPIRLQPEVIAIGDKKVTVEGGVIINTYDLSDEEIKQVQDFMDKDFKQNIVDRINITLRK